MATAAFKDLFSLQAADYARFRPIYPPELYAWLAAKAPARRLAIDVGTGNGQDALKPLRPRSPREDFCASEQLGFHRKMLL